MDKNSGSLMGDPLNDQSSADAAISFMELIRERAFIGEVPSEPIFEAIVKQFEDYINLEDKTNYVDLFYNQLMLSYDRVNSDDSEEHPVEIREALDLLHQRFIDLMQEQFQTRLTIGIADLEAGVVHREDLEFIFRRLYEFFILGARQNFKTVIAKDANAQLENIGDGEEAYFQQLQELMESYNPLLSTIDPMQFLQYRGDEEVYELFDNGRVTGNFLRKYTPKLYQNDEFTVEIINHITMLHNFKSDVIDSDPPELEGEGEGYADTRFDYEKERDAVEEEYERQSAGDLNLDGIDVNKDIETAYNQNEEEDPIDG